MTFDYFPLRLCFTALDAVRFPPGKAGNVLRGALGMREAAGLVRPAAQAGGPGGMADQPRPFVLRARALDGRVLAPGERFEFSVHLFDLRPGAREDILAACTAAARAGFGPGRGRAALDSAESPAEPVRLPLEPEDAGCRSAAIEFLSPTELKPPGPPEFPLVFARARDRVSSLCALYGEGAPAIDYRGLGERARAVRTVRCEVRHVAVERRSARTGQVHPLGGFVGTAEYEGALDEFLPLLRAAEACGVGRHTVWGNGEIRVLPRRP